MEREREGEREREIHARTRPDTHGVPTLTIASTVLPLIIFAFLHYTPLALLSLLYKNHFPFFSRYYSQICKWDENSNLCDSLVHCLNYTWIKTGNRFEHYFSKYSRYKIHLQFRAIFNLVINIH